MFVRTDDPLADFTRYDQEQTRELNRLPKCSYCQEPIQDEHMYVIKGKCICQGCLDYYHRVNIDEYL